MQSIAANVPMRNGWVTDTRLIVERETMESLKRYAPGDGSLHFVWLENDKASGRKVTLEDVLYFVERDQRCRHSVLDGWRVVWLFNQPIMVGPVKRVDDKTLLIKGEPATYSIDETNVFWLQDQRCIDFALTLKFTFRDREYDIKNWGMREMVCHFLTHEKHIVEVTPAEIPLESHKPFYIHDCPNCTFLGLYVENEGNEEATPYDLYYCKQGTLPTVIARYGDAGHDYYSGMNFDSIPSLAEAQRRAKDRGLPGA